VAHKPPVAPKSDFGFDESLTSCLPPQTSFTPI
jgi:hypothetical protein